MIDVALSDPIRPHAFGIDELKSSQPQLFPHQGLQRLLSDLTGEDNRGYLGARITLFNGERGHKIGTVDYMRPVSLNTH